MIIIFDTETTGLTLHPAAELRKQPHIIEVGAVLMSQETGEVTEELSFLVHPGVQIDPIITKITGITNEQLALEPSFAAHLPMLREFFGKANVMAAHNLPFDRALMEFELKRINVTDFRWPHKGVCTVGMYKDEFGHNPSLKVLYAAIIGKPLEQKHRALDDVMAMAEIIQKEKLWQIM